MMTLNEARRIGADKLKLHGDVMDKALEVAKKMEVKPEHAGPMMLALAIMGVAKATDPEELSGELTDALSLVSKAEKEWRMEQTVGRGRA